MKPEPCVLLHNLVDFATLLNVIENGDVGGVIGVFDRRPGSGPVVVEVRQGTIILRYANDPAGMPLATIMLEATFSERLLEVVEGVP